MPAPALFVLAVLGLAVALAEWLGRHTPLRHLGSALLVILIAALVANLGLIPTATAGHPVYDAVFSAIAPMGIFLLLLDVRLATLLRAGAPMLLLFLAGSAGTVLGVLAGMAVVDGRTALAEHHAALAGMFVGTYTGGSVNFNAVALELGVAREGPIFVAASVVDSAMTTVWMVITAALPRLLGRVARRAPRWGAMPSATEIDRAPESDHERVDPLELGLVLGGAALATWASEEMADALAGPLGFRPPSILLLTTLALVLAQLPAVARLPGKRVAGLACVLLFLAVIGALCDVRALAQHGGLGVTLAVFVTVALTVHGVVVFGVAKLARVDPSLAAVASQANVGGGTTALALARGLGRADLALPGVLVGSLGTALGTYLGFLVAGLLG